MEEQDEAVDFLKRLLGRECGLTPGVNPEWSVADLNDVSECLEALLSANFLMKMLGCETIHDAIVFLRDQLVSFKSDDPNAVALKIEMLAVLDALWPMLQGDSAVG